MPPESPSVIDISSQLFRQTKIPVLDFPFERFSNGVLPQIFSGGFTTVLFRRGNGESAYPRPLGERRLTELREWRAQKRSLDDRHRAGVKGLTIRNFPIFHGGVSLR